MAEAVPTRFLRLRQCPVCARALADDRPRCADCGYEGSADDFDLDPAACAGPAPGELVGLFLSPLAAGGIWSAVISTTILAGQPWLTAASVLGLLAHLGWTLRRIDWPAPGHGGTRLFASATGVALARPGRTPRLTRWHLFDEARIEPWPRGEPYNIGGSAADWKLTLVNAYKPSISTYLHRRGTDADIFAPCVEFVFRATASEADTVRRRMQSLIDAAARRYRALDLAEMDRPPLDPAQVLRLARCPQCDSSLAISPRPRRCPRCRERIERGAFALDLTLLAPATGLAGLWMFAGLLAALVVLLAGEPLAACAVAAVALLSGGAWTWALRAAGDSGPARLLVMNEGLRLDAGNAPRRTLPWAQLRTFRAVELESGQWRLAWWTEPKIRVTYAPLVFGWMCLPWGGPVIDGVIRGDERAGPILAAEIERRMPIEGAMEPQMSVAGVSRPPDAGSSGASRRAGSAASPTPRA
ncbi:MAG: hypothetical protein ACYTGG_04390 [Planctomycetota bacterium]|jgi:hypothetical protein